MARYGKVWSVASLEKTFLIGLLFVIFASVLPTTDLNEPEAVHLGRRLRSV